MIAHRSVPVGCSIHVYTVLYWFPWVWVFPEDTVEPIQLMTSFFVNGKWITRSSSSERLLASLKTQVVYFRNRALFVNELQQGSCNCLQQIRKVRHVHVRCLFLCANWAAFQPELITSLPVINRYMNVQVQLIICFFSEKLIGWLRWNLI